MSIILTIFGVLFYIMSYAVAIPLAIFCLFTVASAIVQHFDGVYQKLRGTVKSVFAAPGNWLAKMVCCCWAAVLFCIPVGYCVLTVAVFLLLKTLEVTAREPSWKNYVCDKPTSPELPDRMLVIAMLALSLGAYVVGAVVFNTGLFLLGLCSAQVQHGGIDTESHPPWLAEESLLSSHMHWQQRLLSSPEHWRQAKTELHADLSTEHYGQVTSQYHSQPTIEGDEEVLGPAIKGDEELMGSVKDEDY